MEIITDNPQPKTVIDITFYYDKPGDTFVVTIDEDAGDIMSTDGRLVYVKTAEHKDEFNPERLVPAEETVIYLDKVRRSTKTKRTFTPPTLEQKRDIMRRLQNPTQKF